MSKDKYYIAKIQEVKWKYLRYLQEEYKEDIHNYLLLKFGGNYKNSIELSKEASGQVMYTQYSIEIRGGKEFFNIRFNSVGTVIGVQEHTVGFYIFREVT